MTTTALSVAPRRIVIYVCTGCHQWTAYRRSRCVWCRCAQAPQQVTYQPVEEA